MKIGVSAGYWSSQPPVGVEQRLAEAEAEGFDSFWTAEAYGSDALTPLAWWGARTSTIKLGTSVCQIAARTPTALAMAGLTLDHLSGGRVIIGIGASGPQVVEGWYGQSYPRPLERTREYVEIMRDVWSRERPVTYAGRHYRLPFEGGSGLGKPLKSTVHPLRVSIPIFLGAEGPRNVALAGEIADGWLPLWFSPKSDEFYRTALDDGFKRARTRRVEADFEVAASIPVIEDDDVTTAAAVLKPTLALYIGGMGARGVNFHQDVFVRMGWGDVCAEVQDLYLARRYDDAAAAIPTALVEDVALVGPIDKITSELRTRWSHTCLTTLILSGWPRREVRQAMLTTVGEGSVGPESPETRTRALQRHWSS